MFNTLVPTNEGKEKIKRYEELWSRTRTVERFNYVNN